MAQLTVDEAARQAALAAEAARNAAERAQTYADQAALLAKTAGSAGAAVAGIDPFVFQFTIFVLAIFVGYEVISKVPVILHTPLMSGTNAIHGIVLVGAILVTGAAETTWVRVIGFLGVILGTINVIGGFLVTDRMLLMFAKKPGKPEGRS